MARLKKETKKAGHDFFCVDYVISPYTRQIVQKDTDYALDPEGTEHQYPSYIATFKK